MRSKSLIIVLILLTINCSSVYSHPTLSELEQARLDLVTKEQTLSKAREGVQQRIDRLKTSLHTHERRLESISLRLDEIKKAIIDVDQKILQARPR